MDRKDQFKNADRVAQDNKAQTSNGNQWDPQPSKSGGAERGGPGIETAHRRQPPDSKQLKDETVGIDPSAVNPARETNSPSKREVQQ